MTSADHRSMPIGGRPLDDERGYTLVELLVAAFVLVVGMAGAFALLDGANATTVGNNARMGGTNLSRELLEDARSVDYDALAPSTIAGALQAKMGVTGSPSPWIVARRGIKYTVTLQRLHLRRPRGQPRRHRTGKRLHPAGARARPPRAPWIPTSTATTSVA